MVRVSGFNFASFDLPCIKIVILANFYFEQHIWKPFHDHPFVFVKTPSDLLTGFVSFSFFLSDLPHREPNVRPSEQKMTVTIDGSPKMIMIFG